MNQFSLVQAVDGFCQGIVVAVTATTHRGLNTGLRESLCVADGDVLGASVAMVYQAIGLRRLTVIQRLPQGIEHEVRMHGTADAPAQNATSNHIADDGHIQQTLQGTRKHVVEGKSVTVREE